MLNLDDQINYGVKMDNQTTQMVEDKSRDDKIHMIQNVSTICLVPLVDKKKRK